jgi:ParB family transcriptional regulator, chromosome partitioning protein
LNEQQRLGIQAMRMPWKQTKSDKASSPPPTQTDFFEVRTTGEPLLVSVALLDEDPANPRTEFADAELEELAEDLRQNGMLQPLVVHPADSSGRYRIHFGTRRLRAALLAGLQEVPVVMRVQAADPYAQVAENQKRQGLSPLDLARFIKGRSDSGESNATIAKRLGMNLTSVAHHLALLDLPPELDQVLKTGRCTSPRTLHELSKLHNEEPERARALLATEPEITRSAVASMRAASPTAAVAATSSLVTKANAICDRLEQTLVRLNEARHESPEVDLVALRRRISELASRLA